MTLQKCNEICFFYNTKILLNFSDSYTSLFSDIIGGQRQT